MVEVEKVSQTYVVKTKLDEEYVVDVLEYIEEQDISKSEAIGGLKLQANSSGGRPSKVERWADKIESGGATLEDAREHMSDPTWYKLKEKID